MQFAMGRDELLKGVGIVAGVVERRQTRPILSHVLITTTGKEVTVTGSDLEIEMVVKLQATGAVEGAVTVPGRKLLDILRALPAGGEVVMAVEGERVRLTSGRSRFQLGTLPAEDFPNLTETAWEMQFAVERGLLRRIIEKTQFCMAQQDVRYYLNGVMFETLPGSLKAVAADGHRLALCEVAIPDAQVVERQVIVPRKGIGELVRFLGSEEGAVEVAISGNHIRVRQDNVVFTSKLIDGRFPDYHRVVPSEVAQTVALPREPFREMLARVGVVASEKFRGIRLTFKDRTVVASASNPERDEASEEMDLTAEVPELEVGFNVGYILEAMGAIEGEIAEFGWNDNNSGCRLKPGGGDGTLVYVVMPMRL